MPANNERTTRLRDAGAGVIQEHCKGYETSSANHLLPPVFDSHYTEQRDETTNSIPFPSRVLTPSETNRYTGISVNQMGQLCEYQVFTLFHQLKHKHRKERFLLLRKVDLDNNNKFSVKENELKKEFPTIDLSPVNMKGELDFIVLIKGIGVVLVEVKTTASPMQLEKAEKQLENGRFLMYSIMGGVRGSSRSFVPVEKIVIIPNEPTLPPSTTSPQQSRQLHRDSLQDFSAIFHDVVEKLKSTPGSFFTTADFDHFTKVLVGLWCLTPVRGNPFSKHFASTSWMIKNVDKKVDETLISSFQARRNFLPVTDVEYCRADEVPRCCEEINAIFLTPEQKDLFDNYQQALIEGAAGTGKTLLTMFKVIDLVKDNGNTNQILLVVPPPQHLRCQMILQANNITTEIIEKFPPDNAVTASVCIISLRNFFSVSRDHLLSRCLSSFHIFIDDIQAHTCGQDATYGDIREFIEKAYDNACINSTYFWCCVDVLQSSLLFLHSNMFVVSLLYDNAGDLRHFNIPVIELSRILRNSTEIVPVVSAMRDMRIEKYMDSKGPSPNNPIISFVEVKPGHSITSTPVLYHQIYQESGIHNRRGVHRSLLTISGRCLGTRTGWWRRLPPPRPPPRNDFHFFTPPYFPNPIPFVLQMIESELQLLLSTHQPPPLKPSDIAILLDEPAMLERQIQNFLPQHLGISTQTVEEFNISNNEDSVIMDEVSNLVSFEVPCVIYVHSSTNQHTIYHMYVITSRARVRLTIIDAVPFNPRHPLIEENVTFVSWRNNNGVFEEV